MHNLCRLACKIPRECKISCLVIVGEVAKACHPHIASNEDSDGVVDLFGFKVMVQ